MQGPRVLVTGSAGFLGAHVVGALTALGAEVVEVPHRWADGELVDLVPAVDRCIHLAWHAAPGSYLTDPVANLRSFTSSLELLHRLVEVGCRSLVVAGSSAEYGPCPGPIDEEAPIAPGSVYGAMKAAFHQAALALAPPALSLAWARVFNVVGPGEHPDRLLPMVVRAVGSGQPVELSPGEHVRDYIDVADVAAALVHLAAGEATGTYNVSTGRGTSVKEVLLGLAARVGDPELLRFGARRYGAYDPESVVGRNERLVGTGWRPEHSLDELLDRVAAAWT